ncbi:MAG: helix-hairpin-helix domain-containing protein [Flavobacteriales bacterium]|nr:helix-hairpin-helix domain-containing protein [Flavobacteriales bacterium]
MSIKDYFSFTRGEKRGTVVFLLIIIVLIIANFSVDLFKKEHQTDFSEFETAINEFEKGIDGRKNSSETETLQLELFEFNPNTISNSGWTKLGFKSWQIKTINNYKAKGGSWKSKADVAKIYGLEKNHFLQLKPFILLPDSHQKKSKPYSKKENKKIEYFEFNPNIISKSEWKQLGFNDWQIKNIFNYKSKGGSWRSKADVQQLYGLDEADYYKLEPYILLPDKAEKKQYTSNKKDYTKKVDINAATVKELTNLKGINSEKYAAIIIKHRDKIGGFTSKEQLKEVWSMTNETYNGFISQVIIGDYEPSQVNINSSSASQLQNHPYINWKTAKAIFKYRKANGNYKKVEEIKKIHLINKKTYLKILPYLEVK